VVFTSRHRVVTAQHFTIVNVNTPLKNKKKGTISMTYSRNILTNRRISDNAVAVKVMHTL